jgi:hypothetical protein
VSFAVVELDPGKVALELVEVVQNRGPKALEACRDIPGLTSLQDPDCFPVAERVSQVPRRLN